MLQNNQEIHRFSRLNSSSGYKNNKAFLHRSVLAWALVSVFAKQKCNVAFLSKGQFIIYGDDRVG